MSPNSLMTRASRRPFALARRWRMRVVFPAPRKPVTIVAGILAGISERRFMSGTRSVGAWAGALWASRANPGSFAGAASAPASMEAGAPRRPFLLDRTAGFLARGSSPRAAFPGYGCPDPSGVPAQGYPQTVAGAAADRSAASKEAGAAPHSLLPLEARDRYALDTRPNGGRVNRRRIVRKLGT